MKKILLSTFVASLLLTNFATADTNQTLTSKEVSTKVTQKADNNKVQFLQFVDTF